jgi:cellobiose transport system substrate-binding protein
MLPCCQDQRNFFNESGELIIETSPQVKRVWDVAIRAHEAGISTGINLWSPEWGAALNNGGVAIQLMPAWMMGPLKGNAPDAEGLWDVTQLPESGGNWGGSMIGIPSQTKNEELAYELVTWLLSPEQQLRTFQISGQFPSTPPVYDSPELVGFTDPFFNNAPVGEIYTKAAVKIEGAYLVPNYQMVVTALTDALGRVEDGQMSPDESFKEAVAEIKRQMSR